MNKKKKVPIFVSSTFWILISTCVGLPSHSAATPSYIPLPMCYHKIEGSTEPGLKITGCLEFWAD